MTERRAFALETLLKQVNVRWPNRDKTSDGWIGDKAHASRNSDHNPNSQGIVQAIDIDSDLVNGFDGSDLADLLVASRDQRIKYLISEGRILWGINVKGHEPWVWKPYTGPNGHFHHLHISVRDGAGWYDNMNSWNLNSTGVKDVVPVVGTTRWIQQSLNKLGASPPLKEDGEDGPKTQQAIIQFIKKKVEGIPHA